MKILRETQEDCCRIVENLVRIQQITTKKAESEAQKAVANNSRRETVSAFENYKSSVGRNNEYEDTDPSEQIKKIQLWYQLWER